MKKNNKLIQLDRKDFYSNLTNQVQKKQFSDFKIIKHKFQYFHLSLNDFTTINFINFIVNNFKLNSTYSILIKISCQNNLVFKMCGSQIGIVIKNEHDLDYYEKVYSVILIRIESMIATYHYIDTVDAIEIMYTTIIPQEELKLKNIYNLPLNKQLINIKEVRKNFNENLLPFTTNTSYFGIPVLNKEKYFDLISNNYKDFKFNDSDKFFIFKKSNKLMKFLIISQNINNNSYLRHIFDLETGLKIKEIKDTVFFDDNRDNISFNRKIDSVTLTIKKQKIIKISMDNFLSPIKPIKTNFFKDRNNNFGTFDIESFIDSSENLAKVYALGFFTNIDNKPNVYFLTDFNKEDSQDLILKCIDNMLINKYNNFIFYTHNLGNYDVIFIYNALIKANEDKGFNYYILKSTFREDTIIKLDVKIYTNLDNKNSNNSIKISFVDSLNLLNSSLNKLATDFNVETKKGNFPHSFVNRNNLNYIGNKPDYQYFIDSGLTNIDYNKIYKFNWNLKQECLNYLNNDLICLLKILNEFSSKLYIYFDTQMTEALTITRLSLNIYFRDFYKNHLIPNINKIFLFNFISEGYFGGINEVYIPYGKDLIYLDINSLYPYSALNPMPGTECTFMESFEEKGLDLDNLFGFFYCKISTNDNYFGLLPLHFNNQLIFPNGEYYGTWSSEELKLAKENGYKITVIKGYNFNKVYNTFNDFIFMLYNKKANSTGTIKMICKSLLNNLLGRFGLNIIKPITQIVNTKKRDFIASTRKLLAQKILNDDNFLITYQPNISRQICEEHGLDFIKVLDKEFKTNIENNLDLFKFVSIATSAMVNSYARIHMNKIKLEILKNNGKIYYTDTDSIVINKNYINPNWIGNDLGQFKLEYEIKEAYFISNKTYCLILNNNEIIIKAKGVKSNSLTLEDFKNMYFNKENIKTTKFNTITNFEKGSVVIENKDIILNFDSYKKRKKIYNDKGLWIDTTPLIINNNKTNIINKNNNY